MKPKHKSTKPEEKPTSRATRVFSVGSTSPEDNPFAALLHLQPELPAPEQKPPILQSVQPTLKTGQLDLSKQTATVMRTSKGHSGKTVTLISKLKLSNHDLEELLMHLKKRLGIGGTLLSEDEGLILLLQGDVRKRVESELLKLNAKVKKAGG